MSFSMAPKTREFNRVEFWLLVALFFVLPLVEAPKNLLWAGFIGAWLVQSARSGNWGRPSRGFLAIAMAQLVAVTLATLRPCEDPADWGGVLDAVRSISVGLILAQTRLRPREMGILLAAASAAVVLGLAYGLWEWKAVGRRTYLELNSVGHVNHSALYAAAVLLAAAGSLGAYWERLNARQRVLGGVAVLAAVALMVTWESRGAAIAFAFGLVTLAVVSVRRLGRPVWPAVALMAVVAAVSLSMHPHLLNKAELQANVTPSQSSYRMELANTAVAAWSHCPLTGIGPGNFRHLSLARIREWQSAGAYGAELPDDDFYFSTHGHSLYFNTLAERGTLGILALLATLAFWTWTVMRLRPGRMGTPEVAGAWAAGFSGWVVVFLGGVFNTTLHHEHGMLTWSLLGLAIGSGARPRPAADRGDRRQ